MLFSTAVAAAAAFAPLANAHGPLGVPKIVGLGPRDMARIFGDFKSQNSPSSDAHGSSVLNARASPKECGEGIGSCPQDKCCSSIGYCGTSEQHCYSPGCDYKFGPACPENKTPKGTNTSSIPRAKIGDVPYGTDIFKCKKPGTVAITYDDGPHKDFTAHILDVFKSYNAKATFFVTGNNIGKGQIDITDGHTQDIKRMDAEGHQIGSHTWTHLNLDKITQLERHEQMYKNEMALNNIVGKIPTYMRPPYSACLDACRKDMADLGYHISYFDVDTDDTNQSDPSKIQVSKDKFKEIITKDGAVPEKNQWLAIGHDILDQTANNLTEYMLSTLTKLGYKAVTMGECMNDPAENWYRKFGDAADRKGAASVNSGNNNNNDNNNTTTSSKSTNTTTTGTGSSTPTQTQSGAASGSAAPTTTVSAANGFVPRAVAALSLSAVIAVAFAL